MKKIILLLLIFLIHSESFSQWIQQTSGVTVPLRRVNFINRNTGWICGDAGTILKTTNGGTNWIAQNSGVPNKILSCISPVNDSVVYCVGFFQTILKTIDGGSNWMILENGQFGTGRSYESCFFLNEEIGWIGTNYPGTLRTVDGGKSFIQQSVNSIPTDIYFKDFFNGIFTVFGSTIGTTTNGGMNWIQTNINTPGLGDEDFRRITFINNFTGFVVGSRGTAYKTTNFGVTWDSMGFISQNTDFIRSSAFANDSIGYAGGGNQIFKTTNSGRSWKLQNVSGTGFLPDVFCYSDSIVWVVGNPGHIWFTSKGGQTSINQISENIPESFKLSQNYPNPFNPSTTIKFSIKEKSNYKLEIYNPLGKLISELFNKELSAGEYEYKFDGVSFTSGIYFYKLSSNQFTQTKKMILMK
ncbi:MAG: T9SS type A sorting domain-containing protein [Ignavibacteria bacterium]|nr:T9SS type A sorting domain-containing protein [Ignavibacteria bacterium]